MRAGTFKSFGEAYVGNEPSPEAREAEGALLGSLWKTYTEPSSAPSASRASGEGSLAT